MVGWSPLFLYILEFVMFLLLQFPQMNVYYTLSCSFHVLFLRWGFGTNIILLIFILFKVYFDNVKYRKTIS